MKIKSPLLLCTIVFLILGLVGCSKSSSQASSSSSSNGTTSLQGNTSLTKVNNLLVGTLKLEGTTYAVTKDEATKLLPLWQGYLSLSNSQTSAEAEVDALLNQIQSTMTTNQINAINAMKLTNTDMQDMMQSMGGGPMARGTPNPQSTPGVNNLPNGANTSANPPSGSAGAPPSGSTGGGPSGGGPSGNMVFSGGGPGGDAGSAAGLSGGPVTQGTQDPSAQATAQARFSTQASQVNPFLLNTLITKLEALSSQ